MSALSRGIALSIFVCSCLLGGAGRADPLPPVTAGQTVYVPIYSEVLFGNLDSNGKPEKWPLSVTLAIRNTDPGSALTVRSIQYYDTGGRLLREYPTGEKLGPLATLEVFVEHKDMSGGSGAKFLVVWSAETPVNAPVVEAVHTYFFSTRSIAFTTSGRALNVERR